MRSLNIFLTGGTGFIGKNILEQLGEKYIFSAPTSKELNLLDFTNVEEYIKRNDFDIIIHTAKLGGTRKVPNTAEVAELNFRMFYNIIRNEKYFSKMIFLGSGADYDVSRPLVKVKEEEFDRVVPKDSFGFYKYICSKYIEKADKIINLRLFGIYGRYEDYEIRFISNAICKNIFGLPITMQQNVYFDYLYVNDFIKILNYFILNKSKERFYNLGTGKRIDLLTIAKTINKIANRKSRIVVHKKGLKNEYTCNISRLKKEIKNLKITEFEKTVKELYLWYQGIKTELNREALLTDK